jgi:hypothetical protein
LVDANAIGPIKLLEKSNGTATRTREILMKRAN